MKNIQTDVMSWMASLELLVLHLLQYSCYLNINFVIVKYSINTYVRYLNYALLFIAELPNDELTGNPTLNLSPLSLADPGGRRRRAPPPTTGSISFVFAYVFAKKCMCWRLVPPQQVGTLQWEILDLPLPMLVTHNEHPIVFPIMPQ